MPAPKNISELNSQSWETIREILKRFDENPPQTSSISFDLWLPAPGEPLRPLVLMELIKTDLQIRWARNESPRLESYLQRYPELGSRETLDLNLIFEEFYTRHRYGDRPALTDYQKRFPQRYDELLALFEQKCVDHPELVHIQVPASAPVDDDPLSDQSGVSNRAIAGVAGTKTEKRSIVPVNSSKQGETFPNGYRLVRLIDQGAFGEVWFGNAPGNFPVAIKRIFRLIRKDDQTTQRELRSLEHIRELRHAYLLQTHLFFVHDDRLHIVMDLADGTLHGRLTQCQKEGHSGIPLPELLRYFHESAEALDYMHKEHVVHRDIKPKNMLLLGGHVKLGDFGLSRLVGDQDLQSGTTAGTPAYLAFEVAAGQISRHSDQYSLAVSYVELRLGRLPFSGYSPTARDPKRVDLKPLGEAEQKVIRKALSLEPSKRFSNCLAFVDALAAATRIPEKKQEPRARKISRPAVVGFFFLAALIAGAMLYVGRTPLPDPVKLLVKEPEQIRAGRTKKIPFFVSRVPAFSEPITLYFENVPPDVTLESLTIESGNDSGSTRLKAAPNAKPVNDVPIRVRAVGQSYETETSFLLTVVPYAGKLGDADLDWQPAELEEHPLIERDDKLYFPRIDIRKNNQSVRFHLIMRDSKDPRNVTFPEVFYMMRNKVSVQQYKAFATDPSHPDLRRPRWEDTPSNRYADKPVMAIPINDAHDYGRWLIPGIGDLPSCNEWDKAAGFYGWDGKTKAGPYPAQFQSQPKLMGVGDDLKEPLSFNEIKDAKAPYSGCLEMAGNGLEWTRDLIRGVDRQIEVAIPISPELERAYFVCCRGRNFMEDDPLTYGLIGPGLSYLSEEYTAVNKNLGFRIMFDPDVGEPR